MLGGLAKPIVFHRFSVILDLTYNFLAQVEDARVVGSGGLQSVRITEMLCFTTFSIDFQLTLGLCSR